MLSKYKNKKGQSAIEIAIIFPVIAMLMIYLFDVANVMNAKMTVNTANRAYMRILTVSGASNNNRQYISAPVSQLKGLNSGRSTAETAKLAAMSILSQNNLEWYEGTGGSFVYPEFPNNKRPLASDIKFHNNLNSVSTGFPFSNKICTQVPIRLSKIMGYEIWGKGNVKNGKLTVCSFYVSAISSKSTT